jgi:type III secretion protein D
VQQQSTTSAPTNGRPPRFNPNLLRVVDGMHRGAQVPLEESGLTIIGSADDCDLILMDSGVAPRHAAITVHERDITIRAIDGKIDLDGRAVSPGEVATSAIGTALAIGAATIVIGGDTAEAAQREPQEQAPVRESVPEQRTGESQVKSEEAVDGSSQTPLRSIRSKTSVRVLIASCVVAVSLAAVFAVSSNMSPRAMSPQKRAAQLLKDLELEGEVQVSSPERGVVQLTGTAPNQGAYSALVRGLAANDVRPVLRVAIGDRLAAGVKDVFRVNGFGVDTRYAQGGIVIVDGVSATDRRIKSVIQHALRDVRGLKDIRIGKNTGRRLQAGTAMSGQSGSVNASAKRVVSVVDGSPAYLVTADGARYFVNAILPDGHRVVAIRNGAVTLERDGEQIVVTF